MSWHHPEPLFLLGQHPWMAFKRTSCVSVHFHGVSQLFRHQDLPDPDKRSVILSSTEALQVLGLFLQRSPRNLGRVGACQAVTVWSQQLVLGWARQDGNKQMALEKHH